MDLSFSGIRQFCWAPTPPLLPARQALLSFTPHHALTARRCALWCAEAAPEGEPDKKRKKKKKKKGAAGVALAVWAAGRWWQGPGCSGVAPSAPCTGIQGYL